MNNNNNNDFIKLIGNKSKGYKAYIDIGDNLIHITPEYSYNILQLYIKDEILTSYPEAKILKIEMVL